MYLHDSSFTGELPEAWCNIELYSGECAAGNNFACSGICPSGSGPCDLTANNCARPAPTATPTVTPAPTMPNPAPGSIGGGFRATARSAVVVVLAAQLALLVRG